MSRNQTPEYRREYYKQTKERQKALYAKRMEDPEEKERVKLAKRKSDRIYRVKNRDKKNALSRAWSKTPRAQEYRKDWHEKNRENLKVINIAWRKKNRIRLNEKTRKRRARDFEKRRPVLKARREKWNEGYEDRENRMQRWTVEEDNFLLFGLIGMTAKEIGVHLGRSSSAIQNRRFVLRKGMAVEEMPSLLIGQTERIV